MNLRNLEEIKWIKMDRSGSGSYWIKTNQITQNVSTLIKMHQIESKCIKMNQNVSKWIKASQSDTK